MSDCGHSSSEAPPRDAHRTDLRTVRSALAGDDQALGELARRLACVPAMVRAQHGRFGGRLAEEDLEEVVQETLTAIWRRLADFEGRARLETWAYAVARRQLFQALERARRQAFRATPLEHEPAARTEHEGLSDAVLRSVHESVDSLGSPGSEIVHLKHFEQLTFEEIGRRLGMPTNTAKTRYYRSLDRLRRLLRPIWRELES